MSKKQLYVVIAVLAAIVLYLLFMPARTPAPTSVPAQSEGTISTEAAPVAATPIAEPEAGTPEATVTIEGLFLGLTEEETNFRQSFYYLLLDDGTEVVSIDLRPLIGYSTSNVIEKLGVDRGTRVTVTGTMTDGSFKIASITASE